MEEIVKAAERAAALTRQLLAFSRQQVLQPRILDLNDVVAEIDDMLRRLIGEDVVLVTAPGPGLGSVEADPGQLEQVIMNLAVNARDAMPDGGELRIETGNVDADEESAARHPPMKPGPLRHARRHRHRARGWTPRSWRTSSSRSSRPRRLGKGTGLGLSTVYGIVQQSGGCVYVDSKLGVGTSFTIYLPRVAGAPVLAAPGEASSVARRQRDRPARRGRGDAAEPCCEMLEAAATACWSPATERRRCGSRAGTPAPST